MVINDTFTLTPIELSSISIVVVIGVVVLVIIIVVFITTMEASETGNG